MEDKEEKLGKNKNDNNISKDIGKNLGKNEIYIN